MAFYSSLFLVRNSSGFHDVNSSTEFLLCSSWPDLFLLTFPFSSGFLTALLVSHAPTDGVPVPDLGSGTTHRTPCRCFVFFISVQSPDQKIKYLNLTRRFNSFVRGSQETKLTGNGYVTVALRVLLMRVSEILLGKQTKFSFLTVFPALVYQVDVDLQELLV